MSDSRVRSAPPAPPRTSNLTLLEKDNLEQAVSGLDGKAAQQVDGKKNIVSRFLKIFTSRDESISSDVEAAKAALANAKQDGEITPEEADLIEAKVREAEREISGYSEYKRNVADVVGVGATALATFAGGPVGLGVGAAANVGVHALLEGGGYSWEKLGTDAVTGAFYQGIGRTIGLAKFGKTVGLKFLARSPALARAMDAATRTAAALGATGVASPALDTLGWRTADPSQTRDQEKPASEPKPA